MTWIQYLHINFHASCFEHSFKSHVHDGDVIHIHKFTPKKPNQLNKQIVYSFLAEFTSNIFRLMYSLLEAFAWNRNTNKHRNLKHKFFYSFLFSGMNTLHGKRNKTIQILWIHCENVCNEAFIFYGSHFNSTIIFTIICSVE